MAREGGRPAIIGESPSQRGDRYYRFPLSGAPAEHLCKLAGFEREGDEGAWYWALVEYFDTYNSVERWPGSKWPGIEARETVEKIVIDYDVVVLMGRKAQLAYEVPLVTSMPFFTWVEDVFGEGPSGRPRQVVAIPHSSGLNRLNNDHLIRAAVGETLREAVRRAKDAASFIHRTSS